MKINIWTDGSCTKNPGGNGAWAVLIEVNGQAETFTGTDRNTTSNRMELMAAIKALEFLPPGCECTLYTDSTYVKNGITQWIEKWKERGWKTGGKKTPANFDLWIRLYEVNKRHKVNWQWVKGHSGNIGNDIVDKLASEAVKSLP